MEDKKEKLNIYEKLSNVQSTLKAPKGQFNSFGKYKYRSCEDILEALKPILKGARLSLVITDTLENIGNRYYIKSTATIYDLDSKDSLSNSAYAREEEEKKGMDGSQITGTASSYARKYALNGLFNIDDTKDADTDEYTKRTTEQKATTDQLSVMASLMKKLNTTPQEVAKKIGVEDLKKIDFEKAELTITMLECDLKEKESE